MAEYKKKKHNSKKKKKKSHNGGGYSYKSKEPDMSNPKISPPKYKKF